MRLYALERKIPFFFFIFSRRSFHFGNSCMHFIKGECPKFFRSAKNVIIGMLDEWLHNLLSVTRHGKLIYKTVCRFYSFFDILMFACNFWIDFSDFFNAVKYKHKYILCNIIVRNELLCNIRLFAFFMLHLF